MKSGGDDDGDFDQRLRAAQSRRRKDDDAQTQATTKSGAAKGLELTTEFVGGVLVGVFLGFLFDRLFGTSPWGLIVLLLLGTAAGFLNLMRAARRQLRETAS